MDHKHHYSLTLLWEGNLGQGTTTYAGYGRGHRIVMESRPDILATADMAFRGEAGRHNPEELLLAALSSCHMLSYLALCARKGVNVTGYRDAATGTMITDANGGGSFTEVILHPAVTIAEDSDRSVALALHTDAHRMCFIANSVNFPVRNQPTLEVE